MHVCMHDYVDKHGEVKSIMLELRVNTLFVRTKVSHVPVSRVLISSQSYQPLLEVIGHGITSDSNNVRRKVSFGCSIAYQPT